MPSVYFSRINKMNSVGRWARGVDCVLSGAGDRDQILISKDRGHAEITSIPSDV